MFYAPRAKKKTSLYITRCRATLLQKPAEGYRKTHQALKHHANGLRVGHQQTPSSHTHHQYSEGRMLYTLAKTH